MVFKCSGCPVFRGAGSDSIFWCLQKLSANKQAAQSDVKRFNIRSQQY